MKKILLHSIVIFLSANFVFAQQRYTSSLYQLNGYNLNPAYAGLNNCLEGYLQHKNQWTGIDETPTNSVLQVHKQFASTFGVGLNVTRWNAALLNNTEVGLTGTYHLDLKDAMKLSFGLNLGFHQFGFRSQDVVAFDTDNVLNGQSQTDGSFYSDLGILFIKDNITAGVAIPRLVSSTIDFGNAGLGVERYFTLHGSYKLEQIVTDVDVTPSLVFRAIPANGSVIDIAARGVYKGQFGGMLGYRTRSGFLVGIDYTYNDLIRFGYAYDAGIAKLNRVSNGSHEILVGITLCGAKPKEVVEEPIPVPEYAMNGKVMDAQTNALFASTPVSITNKTTGETQELTTDSTGKFRLFPIQPLANYEIKVEDPNYFPATKSLKLDSVVNGDQQIDLALKHRVVKYFGVVTDAKTKQPLSGVEVSMKNANESYMTVTTAAGRFDITLKDKELNDPLMYNVEFHKPEYTSEGVKLASKLTSYDPKDLMKELNKEISLTHFEKGLDIAKIIDIAPIYFELGKDEITPEAEKELNKVVKVMNENPEMAVELGSHTDCRGSDAFNLKLSDKRAHASADYVKTKITNPERISGKGYGETQPKVDCKCDDCSEEQHQNNRRTEFKIVKMH